MNLPTEPIIEQDEQQEQNIDEQVAEITPETTTENVISDDTKISDLTVGELKAIFEDLLSKTITTLKQEMAQTPTQTVSVPSESDSSSPETEKAPAPLPEPPRKLSLDELFQDNEPVTQSPATGTGSES